MIKILITYPKAAKVVKNYFLSKMLESINDENLPEDFKEHVKNMGMEDDRLVKLIGEAPRGLFDVFDENQLFINITHDHEDGVFRWSVNGEVDSKNYIFRKAAELDAVAEAFKLLNEKLCQIQS